MDQIDVCMKYSRSLVFIFIGMCPEYSCSPCAQLAGSFTDDTGRHVSYASTPIAGIPGLFVLDLRNGEAFQKLLIGSMQTSRPDRKLMGAEQAAVDVLARQPACAEQAAIDALDEVRAS